MVEKNYLGESCIAAIDLSKRVDLTALALVFEREPEQGSDDPVLHALVYFWTPQETMAERSRRDRVHYDVWSEQGYIEAVPGSSIDYHWVAGKLSELSEKFRIKKLVVDPYRIDDLVSAMDVIGLEIPHEEHAQGFQGGRMTRSIDALFHRLYNKTLRVVANPVMRMCASSAVIIMDNLENRKFDKRKSNNRIDGLMALTMAVGAHDSSPERQSVFELLAEEREEGLLNSPESDKKLKVYDAQKFVPVEPIATQVAVAASQEVIDDIYRSFVTHQPNESYDDV
jgi:phage terminase large subunit-like protein